RAAHRRAPGPAVDSGHTGLERRGARIPADAAVPNGVPLARRGQTRDARRPREAVAAQTGGFATASEAASTTAFAAESVRACRAEARKKGRGRRRKSRRSPRKRQRAKADRDVAQPG